MRKPYFIKYSLIGRISERTVKTFKFATLEELKSFVNDKEFCNIMFKKYNVYENRFKNLRMRWGFKDEIFDHNVFELGL